jgi:hypothetical protein
MILNLTHEAVRTVAELTRRADAALVRGAAANAAASLTTIEQRHSEGELVLRHLDHLDHADRVARRRRRAGRVA